MKTTHIIILCTSVLIAGMITSPATAVPVNGHYHDEPHCDPVADTQLTHELGDITFGFPIDEGIYMEAAPTTQTICVPDDGISNDWIVRMVNASPIAWVDLFFVADENYTVGNYDGGVADLSAIPAYYSNAFRIDGTVTVTGGNDNLLFESGTLDEVFEPGEEWTFLVSNFSASGPPVFGSIGAFSLTSATNSLSNASILANPVPEPATMLITLIGGVSVAVRRRLARS